MRFSDIALAQPALRTCMCPLTFQASSNEKVLGTYFIHGNCKRFASTWQSLENNRRVSVSMRAVEWKRVRCKIRAVATLQPRCPVPRKDRSKNYEELAVNTSDQEAANTNVESPSEDSKEVEESEKLRRLRISKANKGNTPWNKGRKHSPETLRKIRERTRLAMQNPKVKMKLANLGHAQSKETREKIGIGVQIGWKKRRAKLLVQEGCFFSWQNIVAEAARLGLDDEEEYLWESYEMLNEQLEQEWLESREERRTNPKPKGNKRAPKPLDQRRKIAEAIAAKWADPNYREKVRCGLAKYHGTPDGVERKRRRPSGEGQSSRRSSKKEVGRADIIGIGLTEMKPRRLRSKGPKYKDPLTKVKLEMIKNIRAQRVASNSQRNEALERAKLMIAEAEKAAKALEVAAMSSPVARASLLESRKLIAEAVRSIESIESKGSTISDVDRVTGPEHGEILEKGHDATERNPNGALPQLKANGVHALFESNGRDEDLHLLAMPLSDLWNGFRDEQKSPMLSGYEVPRSELEGLMEKLEFEDVTDQEIGSNGALVRDSKDVRAEEMESNGAFVKNSKDLQDQGAESNGTLTKDLKDLRVEELESNGDSIKYSQVLSDREIESNGAFIDSSDLTHHPDINSDGASFKDFRNATSQELKSNVISNERIGASQRNGVCLPEIGEDREAPSTAVTKRWVRGRLIEVVGD